MPFRIHSCLYRPYILALGALLFIAVNIYGISDQLIQKEIDRLKILVQQCPTDTAKFKILYNFFWKSDNSNLIQSKLIGNWAYDEIKNSKNIKFLSDGFFIKGFILQQDGNLDSACYFFEKSLMLAKTKGYDSRIEWCSYYLGQVYNSLGKQEKAINNMKNAILYFSKTKDIHQVLNCTWFIGDIYERLGKYDSALVYYNIKRETHKKDSDKVGEIAYHLQIADFYKRQNLLSESLKNLYEALTLAESLKKSDPLAGVYSQIGDFFMEQKQNYVIAHSFYNKALEIVEKQYSDPKFISLYIGVGQLFLKEGKDSIALKYNLKAAALAEKINHRHLKSSSYKNLGFTYKNLHNYPLAEEYFRKCFETGCGICPKITFHQALIEIADINLNLNNRKEARVYYFKALELAKNFHAKKEIARTSIKIGDFYKVDQQQLAGYYYKLAVDEAKDAKDVSLTRDCAKALSDYYFLEKDYKNAYTFVDLAKKMNDSLALLDRLADMSDLQMRFVFEKVKKDAALKEIVSKKEIRRQKLYRNFALIIMVFLIFTGAVIYRNYRKKKKDNLLLTKQKDEILLQKESIESKINDILQNKKEMEDKLKKQISVNPSDIDAASLDEQFLIKLTILIEKYLSDPQLDVDFLSKEMGMSRQHLHKKLKTLTNYKPNEFIRIIRLKRAAQLLKIKTGSVSQIAYETGFDNLSYFTKRFKEYFHVLPSDFK